jgi:ferric-dicitrate binding protein FerR (iron transport regulator)
LQQAVSHTATAAELQELSDLIQADESGQTAHLAAMLIQAQLPSQTADYDEAYWDPVANAILQADKPAAMPAGKKVPLILRRAWMAAAVTAGVLLLAGGAYWVMHRPTPAPPGAVTTPVAHDVAPGGNKAVLILADGTQVPLDSTTSGVLAQQGGTTVSKQGAGQLAYTNKEAAGSSANIQYNTLRTPRGGQFRITLPDGTNVWLNAASTITYPTAFNGSSRQVTLSGEAYFEVAANAAKPFRVNVLTRTANRADSMLVTVLGTHFNIMAYDDEQLVKTTLLQGAVQVSSHGSSRQLRPGQGASLDKQRSTLAVQDNVNTEEAVAWKNGFIQLEGNDITSAMRLIARWYDVEVVYKAPVRAHFRGIIPRNVPVSQVLKMMALTGEVHFEIKDRQIIVSP